MGSVPELVAALAFLGILRTWDAREEDRKSRQEEVFVPFNLPPVKPQATAEAQPPVAASSSDAMPIGV